MVERRIKRHAWRCKWKQQNKEWKQWKRKNPNQSPRKSLPPPNPLCTAHSIPSAAPSSSLSSVVFVYLEKNPEKNEGNGWMNFVKETEICIQFIKGNAFFFGNCESFWHMMMMMMRDSIQIFEEEGPDAVCSVVAVLALFEWIIYGSHMDPFGPSFSCFWSLELRSFIPFFFLDNKVFFFKYHFFFSRINLELWSFLLPKKKNFFFFSFLLIFVSGRFRSN